MLGYLKLTDIGPAAKIELDLAPRANLLTGDNGLGKSFLLDIAWWALTRSWPAEPARPVKGAGLRPQIIFGLRSGDGEASHRGFYYSYQEQTWPLEEVEAPKADLTLYARIDGSFSVWDPCRNYWPPEPRGPGPRTQAAFHFSRREVWEGLRSGDEVLCKGLIDDWVLWQRSGDEPFEQLRRVLEHLSPAEQEVLVPGLPTRVKLTDVRDVPTLRMPYGLVPLTLASAAVKRIVAFAYLLVWAWQEHLRACELLNREPERRIVFLIDELEAHLHPRWQRVILPALLEVAATLTESDQTEIQLIASSHAPMVLASMEPIFDAERDALFVLDLVAGQVEISRQLWRPRGDASAWLTSEIFDLGEARSLPAERAIRKALDAIDRPDLPLEQMQQIHRELREVLKDTDPFWVRWRYRAGLAGIEP